MKYKKDRFVFGLLYVFFIECVILSFILVILCLRVFETLMKNPGFWLFDLPFYLILLVLFIRTVVLYRKFNAWAEQETGITNEAFWATINWR